MLFGVLLISVAVAAWLVYSRRAPVRRAAEMLAEIRRKGLAQFLKPSASRWFLLRADGQTVGWHLTRSYRRSDGRFEGINVTVRFDRRGARTLWEWWLLDDGAAEGLYQAGTVGRSALSWHATPTSRIELRGGRVFASQPLARDQQDVEAAAPENYLPEGTLELAMRLVAQRKTRAQFKVMLVEMGPLGQTTGLATFLMRSGQTDQRLFPAATARLELQVHGRWNRSEEAYFFDGAGSVVGRLRGTELFVPASSSEVRQRFPTAVIVLAAVSQQTGFPQASQETPDIWRLFWPTRRPAQNAPGTDDSDSGQRPAKAFDRDMAAEL